MSKALERLAQSLVSQAGNMGLSLSTEDARCMAKAQIERTVRGMRAQGVRNIRITEAQGGISVKGEYAPAPSVQTIKQDGTRA